MSTVSIILPTYNRAKFLGEAISSAISQTYADLEVLIVDDGSSDGTRELVDSYARNDSRIRYFYQDNAGVSVARNRALAEAQGDVIAFLDSDDVWMPWKLELQVGLLKARKDVGMCWTDMDAIRPDGQPLKKNFLRTMYSAYNHLGSDALFPEMQRLGDVLQDCPDEWADAACSAGHIYSKMFMGNLVHTPTVVLRRSWADEVGPFDETMKRGGEDFKYHLATTRLGNVAFLNVPSILYRVGNGDQITNGENNLCYAQSYLRTLQEELGAHGDEAGLSPRQINLCMAEAHEWLSSELLNDRQPMQSIRHAVAAMYHHGRPGTSLRTIAKCLIPRPIVDLIRECIRPNVTASHT